MKLFKWKNKIYYKLKINCLIINYRNDTLVVKYNNKLSQKIYKLCAYYVKVIILYIILIKKEIFT
jgi:hypothetical protein